MEEVKSEVTTQLIKTDSVKPSEGGTPIQLISAKSPVVSED